MADWIRLYGPGVLAWAFVVGKLVDRRGRTGSAIWFILLGLACSLTVMAPVPYRLISEVTGVANLGRLVSHLAILLVAVAAQLLFLRLNQSLVRPVRYVWWPATVAVVITVLFVLADTPVDDVRFAGRYAGQPWVLEYWLVFVAGLAPAFVRTILLCWRYGGLSGTVTGRLGLRAVAVGIGCSLLYHVHKALFFAAARFGVEYPKEFGGVLDRMLPLLAAIFVLVGVTLPTWALFGWFTRLRDYHRLRPLWFALYQATPHIALVAPRPLLLDLVPADLDLLLYRRVIEIRDGRLALQPYLDPDAVPADGSDAEVEASMLAAAVAAKRAGAPARDNDAVAVAGGRDLRSDTAFLIDVARAYRKAANAVRARARGVSA